MTELQFAESKTTQEILPYFMCDCGSVFYTREDVYSSLPFNPTRLIFLSSSKFWRNIRFYNNFYTFISGWYDKNCIIQKLPLEIIQLILKQVEPTHIQPKTRWWCCPKLEQ